MRSLLIIASLLVVIYGIDVRVVAAAPSVTVQSPTNGAQITGNTVTVTFRVTDLTLVPTTVPLNEAGRRPEANRPGEGHLHFMLDLNPVVVWERTDPYTFTNVPAGEHRLMVELTNNDHSSLSPPVVQVIQFTVAPAMPTSGAGGGAGIELPFAWVGALAVPPLLVLVPWLRRRWQTRER